MEFNRTKIKMIVATSLFAIIAIGGFVVTKNAVAQIGTLINFAGKVTGVDGSELADGVYDFTFRLYDTPTGGSLLWTETLNTATRFSGTIATTSAVANGTQYEFTGATATSTFRIGQYLNLSSTTEKALIVDYDGSANTVTVASGSPVWTVGQTINNRPYVEGGVININLGSVSDLSSIDFNQARYLEIDFNGETMQPRKLLTEAPRAIDSIQLGGKTESEFATLAENETITGEWSFTNIVDIATSSTQTALTVTQNGTGNIVDFVGSSTTVSILADGRLQIGDYILPANRAGASPGYVLKTDLSGNLYWGDDLEGVASGEGLWSSTTQGLVRLNDSGATVVLGNIATTSPYDIKFEVEGFSWFDNIGVSNGQQLRLYDADSSNYIAFRATSSVATNMVLTLPGDAGTDGYALVTDGNGNLRWDSPTSFVYVRSGQQGQVPYYASSGSQLSATSSVYISETGGFGIGTTTFSTMFAVGGTSGNQFLVDSSGQVIGGTWTGNVIGVAYGGTGTSTFESNSILYASADDTIGEILAGGNGLVLKMVGGTPTWAPDSTVGGESSLWATSTNNLAIYPNPSTSVVIIGASATTTTGYILEVAGSALFGGSISAQDLSLINDLEVQYGGTGSSTPTGILVGDGAGNIVSLPNNNTNWNTAFSWGDHALGNYFSTTSGHILTVEFGGTGTTTFEANSLVYASSDDTLGEILAGPNGYALVMQGGQPTWASTSPGTSHDLLSLLHSDTAPGVVARGDLITGQGVSTAWTRLGLGANGFILRSDGTDITWATTTDITSLGNVTVGAWQADPVEVAFGGTGLTSYTLGDILIATSSGEIAGLGIGSQGYILQSVNGRPEWVSTSSLNMDISAIAGTLDVDQGGTGQDFSGATGFLYFDNGIAEASSTIAITYTDLADDNTGVELTGNILSLDTSGDWTGTFDNQEGSYYLNAVNLNNFALPFSGALNATSTDALAQGSTNLYWAQSLFDTAFTGKSTTDLSEGTNLYWTNGRFDTRFDGRLNATTSLPNLSTLSSLQTVGTITSGTWQGDVLSVAYGGTGTSTFEANSVLYASANDTVGEILAGANGLVLKMVSGTPTWAPDSTVGGESSLWATSSNNLLVYPTDITKIVVVGALATSSTNTIFEVAGNALFSGSISAQDLSLINDLEVQYGGTGSSTPTGILVGDGAGNIVSLQNNSTAWNTAVTWGDHASANYFDKDTDIATVALGGTGTSTFEAFSILYASADDTIGEILAGPNGYALVMQGGRPTWSSSTPGVAHPVLGAQHSDTEATTTVQGDIMFVNSSNIWTRLGIGANGYVLRANAGQPEWQSTVNITELGTITSGTWQGSPIDIAYGGTGGTTAEEARLNLGLRDMYDFGINSTGTVGWLWQSDGDGRGQWVATTTLGFVSGGGNLVSKFIGTTTATTDGSIATGTLQGYAAANNICAYEYPDSHFCRTYDILVTIEQDDISIFGGGDNAWIAEGPPGYTYDSNDCQGWTSDVSTHLGAFWAFDDDGGGMGWLVNCQQVKPVACCSWQ